MPHTEVNLVLDSTKIRCTIKTLEKRIEDRFPDSSLLKTCKGFIQIADHIQDNIDYIKKPNFPIRFFTLIIILMGVVALIYSFTLVKFKISNMTIVDVVTLAEATINDVILLH